MIYDAEIDNPLNLLELAAKRALSVVNMLLEESGSNERLYSLNGGNDHFALFLTEDIYKTISKFIFIKKAEKPANIPNLFMCG